MTKLSCMTMAWLDLAPCLDGYPSPPSSRRPSNSYASRSFPRSQTADGQYNTVYLNELQVLSGDVNSVRA